MLIRRLFFVAFLLSTAALEAQPLRAPDRIRGRIDDARRIVLSGSRHPKLTPDRDLGAVSPSEPLNGLTLHVKLTAAQQAELDRLLADQQDPASPRNHVWLTPEEYADRFGLSAADFEQTASWLASQGLTIDYKARSRTWIGFSGDAQHVQAAFGTQIHRYQFDGAAHYANSSEVTIPEALEPVVLAIGGLDDDKPKPFSKIRPLVTGGDNSHALAPGDLAAIYNIAPLYAKGITGAGQKIAIPGQSGLSLSDVQSFRSAFGLSRNDPQTVLVPGYPDPGTSDPNNLGEALLDVEYSGAIAPAATIVYVYSPNALLSLLYIIDQDLAPVVSYSYGGCEAAISAAGSKADAYRAVAQQANVQGMTWVASSGDSGAAACEPQGSSPAGVNGIQVNLPASVPEVTAVGGSEFNEGSGNYWGRYTGSPTPTALSYIPEMAWNDTAAEGGLASTGGGASIFFPKPSWQTGVGVPAGTARYVPDIALSASWTHDPYIVVFGGQINLSGGTSAASPVFAGVLALLNHYLVSNRIQATAGVGNANLQLYRLAQTTQGVFHDITQGSNIVPCASGTPNCTGTGRYGYSAGAGYDLATGLGSLDVNNLVTLWNGAPSAPSAVSTTLTATAAPASILVNASTVLTATVKAASGNTPPTGSVTFRLGNSTLGTAALSGSGSSASATLTVYGSQIGVGAGSVQVSYGGTTNFGSSSASVTVTVTAAVTSSAVIPSIAPAPVYQQDPDDEGYAWFYSVRLTEIGGTATTITGFSIAGTDHTADIQSFFGSATLPAHGTLTANLRSRGLTAPVDRLFVISGSDASGQRWTQQLTVTFLPQQIAAAMALSSSPETEVQNPKGDPSCAADHPFYQQLNLQELNGIGVQLTKFVAAGSDLTDSLVSYFGSQRLAPLGALRANICWRIGTLPTTLKYEIDGIDRNGRKVTASLSVPFQAAGQNAGALSASRSSINLTASAGQSATATLSVNVPAGQNWSLSLFPNNQNTSWLVVFPQSGSGTTTVNLVAASGGIPNGVHTANLVFQSVNTIPQFVNVPVTFTVGASSSVSISGVTNGASFGQSFAPGMILSIFGTKLSNSTKAAASVPLPIALDGVSVTVNGVRAPLYYISPGQLNVQVPYETAAGTAVLGVNNNGLVASSTFAVKATAPGIFTGAAGALVPISSARRGESILLYVTGEGDTTPILDTGAPPSNSTPLSGLPAPLQHLTMTVGGVPVAPFFTGIPYGLVGVTQVNFTVPPNAPLGVQPVIVTVGGVASKAAAVNITAASAATAMAPELRPFFPEVGSFLPLPVVHDSPQRRD